MLSIDFGYFCVNRLIYSTYYICTYNNEIMCVIGFKERYIYVFSN